MAFSFVRAPDAPIDDGKAERANQDEGEPAKLMKLVTRKIEGVATLRQ
jgi:hypothetical protein